MAPIPQLAFASVMRSARTKERNRDFDFSDLSLIGYPGRNDPSFPLKGKAKEKSTTLWHLPIYGTVSEGEGRGEAVVIVPG